MNSEKISQSRWLALWSRLGGRSPAATYFTTLVVLYTEPHRAYHTLEHIEDCLTLFDQVKAQAHRPDEVELALWLHDVIYDPQASDNEEKSAQWASECMKQTGISDPILDRVAGLILATRHRTAPDDPDAQLLVDIDLSILGRSPALFAAYEAQIQAEYQWMPETAYRQGRRQILEAFLKRDSIYQTPFFKARYEAPARANLERSIAALKGSCF